MRRLRVWLVSALGLLLPIGCTEAPPLDLMGAYRLDDGHLISVRSSIDGTLRYRVFESGASGRLHRDGNAWVAGPGFSDREPVALTVEFEPDRLRWTPAGDGTLTARRCVEFEGVQFESGGVEFHGQIALPAGEGPFPGVVLVHGSGDHSALEFFYDGDFFAAHGVATLTFDKRGTGRSGGEVTFDYGRLARDVLAGLDVLAAHPRVAPDRLGLCGYSQGGWVAPLAASYDERVRFVAVAYGMIESSTNEAIWETQDLMRRNGASDEDIEDATPLITAAVNVVAQDFSSGWDALEREDDRTAGARWREMLKGSPVLRITRYPVWITRILGRRAAPPDLDWSYSSDAVLEALEIPMTWFLATEDRSAPNAQTILKLRELRSRGKPFELVLFEGADHTMVTFVEENGERRTIGYAPGYFQAQVDHVLRMSGQ